MRYFKLLAVMAALTMLAGCPVAPLMMVAINAPSKSVGELVNFDYAKTITPKVTTRSEVVAGMGKPALVTQDGDIETWKYEHRVHPGAFDGMVDALVARKYKANQTGDNTVVTVVFRGDIVAAVAGSDFNQEKGAEVKFSKGETQLIPIYQGGRRMVTIPQTVSAQPPAADTTEASQQTTESAAIPVAVTQNQAKPASSKPKKKPAATAN